MALRYKGQRNEVRREVDQAARAAFELAGELGAEELPTAVPDSTRRDPQQTNAAGPELWGAPD